MKNNYKKYGVNLIVVILLFSNLIITLEARDRNNEWYGKTVDATLTSAGIIIKENIIYMTFNSRSFQKERQLIVIDISNPEKPKLLNKISISGFPQNLAISGKTLYIVNGAQLLIFDIREKTNPKLITSFSISNNPLYGPQGVDVKGNLIFLGCRKGGVIVVDVSNLKQPKIISSIDSLGLAVDVTIKGDYLYVANDTKGMVIMDIKDPKKLQITGKYRSKNGTTSRVIIKDKYAFLAEGFHLLKIVNISNPTKPVIVSSYRNRGALCFFGSYSYDIDYQTFINGGVKKNFVYLADGESGIQIIDVTDIQKPKFSTALMSDMGLGSPYEIKAIAVKDSNIFCNDDKYGLRVLKINGRANPIVCGKGVKLYQKNR